MKRRTSVYTHSILLLVAVTVFAAARKGGHFSTYHGGYCATSGTARVASLRVLWTERVARASDFLASDPSGWEDLVPYARSWARVPIPPDKPLDPGNQWSSDRQKGMIFCEGDRGHEWLRFERELANFLLHVEWRFDKREGLKGYNSGVFVRNSRDGRVWHQAQVGASAYLFGQTLVRGTLSPIIKAPPMPVDPLHPIGEWNTYEIRCEAATIKLWVNGVLTSEFAVPEVPKGYLGLEAEGYRIAFRNIKLKILP